MDEEHKKILKILYESYTNNKGYQIDNKDLKEKSDFKQEELITITNYLEGEGYIKIEPYLDGFETTITYKGIKLAKKWSK
jgi:CTP-dependent riboflavin kinase